MKLSSLIEKDLILVNQKVSSRDEAIRKSVQTLIEKKKIDFDANMIIKAITDRDKLGGTVFKTGLAIPHARIKDYADLSIIICIPEEKVDVNGDEVSCFVVIVTSMAVSNLYLQLLATLARISKEKDIYNRILDSQTSDEVLNIVNEIYVKKELTVEDLMSKEFGTASPEMDLKELTDLFYLKKTSYLPVLSDGGEFLGEVRINDLISVGIPDYAVTIGDLGFMHNFAPLETLLNNEENIQVKSIMKKSLVSLRPESSVIEAALKITQGNFRHLPVIRDGQLVGILNVMDILNKVLRG